MPQSESVRGAQTYRRLLTYAAPYRGVFVIVALAMVVFAATEPAFAALMQPMLDESFVNRDPAAIRLIPFLIIGLFILRGLAGFGSTYGMAWVGRGVIYQLRRELFDKLLRLPSAYYDKKNSGELVSRLTFNIEQVAQASTDAVTVLVRDTLTVLGLLGYMFYLNGWLSLIFLICGPVVAIMVSAISHRFRRISTRIQNTMGEVTHITQEAIGGQQIVKTFGGQAYEAQQFEHANRGNRRQHLKLVATALLNVHVVQVVAASALAGIIYLATTQASVGSPGEFISFITALMLLLAPIKRLTMVNSTIQRGIAAAQSVFELLDTPGEPDSGRKPLTRARGAIVYDGLGFSYAGSERPVLQDISLHIEPGETVAIVGRSGSGKTTLVSLLPRFYEYNSGRLLLDGLDVREYRLADLRSQIALVNQNVILFNDTIGRNIAYGGLEGTGVEQIRAAAQAAHALEFIDALPEGMDTLVGERGLLLSGGQRQRIAIARALLKNAPILILDEAMSALDTESEYHVQAGLDRLMEDRTTLVIAHRLSTIERADRIVVMHDGRIVETGGHAELLAKNGHYASLHRMQFADPA